MANIYHEVTKSLYLKIVDPEKTIFEGNITSLTSTNEVGKFDVLENHSNFISVIKEILTVKIGNDTREFKLTDGVMKIKENKIYVYVNL